MDVFTRALQFTLKWEGKYSNDPNDPGKLTMYGISQKSFPDVISTLQQMNEEQQHDYVLKFYYTVYWKRIKAERLHPVMAMVLFDTAVNLGRARAVRIFQQVLRILTKRRIAIDGIIGPQTLGAWDVALLKYTPLEIALFYLQRRYHYYVTLVRFRSSLRRFLYGWGKRVDALTCDITKWWREDFV